jgi:peptide deformylase
MPEREVVRYPASVLKTPTESLEPGPEAEALARDLVDTMRASAHSVGIAATQIGVGKSMFVLDITGHKKARSQHGLIVMMNPEILSREDSEIAREGCMSVPDFTGDVKRALRIVVQGQRPDGETFVVEADAFEARALQHEIDHLAGLLFLDRVESPNALFQRKRYR